MPSEKEIWFNREVGELVIVTYLMGEVKREFFKKTAQDKKEIASFDQEMYAQNGYAKVRTC
jgi:Na+-transporting methylmalonyl-CoA/oxaloacetate decarboxylase gamma subunit